MTHKSELAALPLAAPRPRTWSVGKRGVIEALALPCAGPQSRFLIKGEVSLTHTNSEYRCLFSFAHVQDLS